MQALNGFLSSEYFSSIKNQERELERGKSDFSLYQAWTLASCLESTLDVLNEDQKELKIFKAINKVCLFLNYTGLFANLGKLFSSKIVSGLTKNHVAPYCSIKVIETSKVLKNDIEKFVLVCEKHLSIIIEVAQIVAVIAITAFGHYAFGIGYGISYLHQVLDRNALIPQKISSCFANFIGCVSVYHNFFMNPGIFSSINAFLVTSTIFASIPACQKVIDFVLTYPVILFDQAFKYLFIKNICGYVDVIKPMSDKKQMGFSEIRDIILTSDLNKFSLCMEALSKKALGEDELDENQDLDKLKALFQTIDWSQKRSLIVAKLKIDERFRGILEDHGVSKDTIEKNLDQTVIDYFDKEVKKPEDYLIENFEHLLGVCESKRGFESYGSKGLLKNVIKTLYKVNAYLLKLGNEQRIVELEDLFLKLGIEAGKYCNLGLKRALDEIIEQMLDEKVAGGVSFETKIFGHLEKSRKLLSAAALLEGGKSIKVDHLLSDIHMFDQIKWQLYGFIPLNQELNFYEFVVANTYSHILKTPLLYAYFDNLDFYLSELGLMKINEHLKKLISANTNLREIEKLAIEDLLIDFDQIPIQQMQKRANRLLLCMLGIIKKI